MADDPAFLFYPGDYLRDTQNLSEKTQVAYDRIMCEHMRNICISKSQLKFFTKKLSPDEFDELQHLLIATDNGFQIKWVATSIEKRRNYSESRRSNRIGLPKKQKKSKKHINNISSSYDKHMENENENENINGNEVKDVNENTQDFDLFLGEFNKITGRAFKGGKKEKGAFRARILDGYNPEQMYRAIKNCFSDPFHRENPNYLTPEFILRQDKLEKYLNYIIPINNGKQTTATGRKQAGYSDAELAAAMEERRRSG